MRLTAGNRRAGLFMLKGVPFVPVTALVADIAKFPDTLGEQLCTRKLLIPLKNESDYPFDERNYRKPSEIFPDLADMKSKGLLPFAKFS